MALTNFQGLWNNYPAGSVAALTTLIGGKVKVNIELPAKKGGWDNTCVVRTSRAFNYSGQPIHRTSGVNTVSGRDGKWYAFRVTEFVTYMKRFYGEPARVWTPSIATPKKEHFADLRGVITFSQGTSHFDIWDGKNVKYNDQFAPAKYIAVWQCT